MSALNELEGEFGLSVLPLYPCCRDLFPDALPLEEIRKLAHPLEIFLELPNSLPEQVLVDVNSQVREFLKRVVDVWNRENQERVL